MTRRIVFASRNRQKFEEMRFLFQDFPVELLFGGDFSALAVEETGDSYSANALLKARAWAEELCLPALGDDSGLEVEALAWEPGLLSARIAPSDEERIAWLLRHLDGQEVRRARFVAALTCYFPKEGRFFLSRGVCTGHIAHAPEGKDGFGYDPVFIPDGYEKSFGILGDDVKARISHRARAVFRMKDMLFTRTVLE
jgi:XTP/dITP diphosphohydrolase